jgi:hypothetical protein
MKVTLEVPVRKKIDNTFSETKCIFIKVEVKGMQPKATLIFLKFQRFSKNRAEGLLWSRKSRIRP